MKPLLLVFLLSLFASDVYAVNVKTVQVVSGSWQDEQAALGRISPRQEAFLSLPFAARIIHLEVEPGVVVRAGQTLIQFDAPQLRKHLIAWYQNKRLFTLARKHTQELRQGEKQQVIPRIDMINAEQDEAKIGIILRMAWETLAGDLDALSVPFDERDLAQQVQTQGIKAVTARIAQLQAPFNGVIVKRLASQGELLAAGAPAFEIESLDRVYLDVAVPEESLTQWQEGESYWRTGTKQIVLKRLTSPPRYDEETGLWLLRFVANNTDMLLRDGAWVEVQHRGLPQPVVWVPASAIAARNGKTWCMVVKNKRPHPVEVQVGVTHDHTRIPVLKGLQPGDKVVIEGAYELLYRDLKELIKFED